MSGDIFFFTCRSGPVACPRLGKSFIISAMIAAAFSTVVATPSWSATFRAVTSATARDQQNTQISCTGVELTSTTATSSCSNGDGIVASAQTGNGVARVYAEATIVTDGTQFLPGSVSDSYAETFFRDEFTFEGITSGTFLLSLDILGSLSVNSDRGGIDVQGTNGVTQAVINGGIRNAQNTQSISFLSRYRQIMTETGVEVVVDGLDLVDTLALTIENGATRYVGSLLADARCGRGGVTFGVPESCSSIVDFGASLRFVGATVLDDTGTDVTSYVSVFSTSGFDYVTGVAPHERVSVVPLPSSVLLLIGGLSLLGFGRYRTKS